MEARWLERVAAGVVRDKGISNKHPSGVEIQMAEEEDCCHRGR